MRRHPGFAVALLEYSSHVGPEPPFPGAGFDSFTTRPVILKRETHKGLQQHKSVMSTADNYHDQNSRTPEVASPTLPLRDRIWGLFRYLSIISSHICGHAKEWEFFFFSKQKVNLMQELNSVLFTLPRIPCLYRIAMISGHTLYLRFTVCELVVHLTISGASQLLWHDCRHPCMCIGPSPFTLSIKPTGNVATTRGKFNQPLNRV